MTAFEESKAMDGHRMYRTEGGCIVRVIYLSTDAITAHYFVRIIGLTTSNRRTDTR